MNELIQTIYNAVLEGEKGEIPGEVQAALDAKVDPAEILSEGMIAAMREVGRRFEEGDYFIPEMLVSARTMQAGLAVLKPALAGSSVQAAGRVAIGTVKGDLHDIGKNLVAMMLEGAGFEVVDLGVDVTPEKFVAAVKEQGVQIVAMSALLTTTMPVMETTVHALEAAGLRSQVKVMIGGAPVNQAYADKIGADGFTTDASRAVSLAQSLVGA
jgi:5-methyltetrahydrofolate--homocysteine methyltransferase